MLKYTCISVNSRHIPCRVSREEAILVRGYISSYLFHFLLCGEIVACSVQRVAVTGNAIHLPCGNIIAPVYHSNNSTHIINASKSSFLIIYDLFLRNLTFINQDSNVFH